MVMAAPAASIQTAANEGSPSNPKGSPGNPKGSPGNPKGSPGNPKGSCCTLACRLVRLLIT